MKITRVCAVYWSATGNTEKIVRAMGNAAAKALRCPLGELDFTIPAARETVTEFQAGDLVIVGSPTYAGKLPNKILPDFQSKLKGNGARAVAVVTYGNRSFDNSLAELVSVLKADGFITAGGAAFACRHAFSDLLAPGRPDDADLKAAETFVREVPEGEASYGHEEVHEVRLLRQALSCGIYRSGGCDECAGRLHQMPGLRPGMRSGCEVFRRSRVPFPCEDAGAELHGEKGKQFLPVTRLLRQEHRKTAPSGVPLSS